MFCSSTSMQRKIEAPAGHEKPESLERKAIERGDLFSTPLFLNLSLIFTFRSLKSFLQIFPRLFQSAESIVVGLDGLPVLVDGSLPLTGDIENFSELHMAPDLGPARIAVAIDG